MTALVHEESAETYAVCAYHFSKVLQRSLFKHFAWELAVIPEWNKRNSHTLYPLCS
jgi:hypothetical protein